MRHLGDLTREARWRKESALEWYHLVTSEMNHAEVVLASVQFGLAINRNLHALQTDLLQFDDEAMKRALISQRAKAKRQQRETAELSASVL